MTIKLLQKDYHNLFEEAELTHPPVSCDEFETIFYYPKQLGEGYQRSIQLRRELYLDIESYYTGEQVQVKSFDREHPIEFKFIIKGDTLINGDWFRCGETVLYGSGLCLGDVIDYLPQQNRLELTIHLSPEQLKTLILGDSHFLPETLTPLFRDCNSLIYSCHQFTTPAMQLVIRQILNCPYQGLMKRLYLESKVMELITLRLEQFLQDSRTISPFGSLQTDDIDRIYEAKTLLIQQLDQPPSVEALARKVGLNRRKLNDGFREVLGTTPFSYLRNYRLEQARQLLATSELSVEEIALKVGYLSRGNFATAFRKKFGMNPKPYQLQQRNCTSGEKVC